MPLIAPSTRTLDIEVGVAGESQSDPALAFWRVPWVRDHYIVQALRALHVLQRDHHLHQSPDLVVQRIPAKIVLDAGEDKGHELRPGMSVEAKVRLD